MRCFLGGLFTFLVAALLTAIAVPSYGDFSARANLSETMLTIQPLQEQIGEIVTKQRGIANIAAALKLPADAARRTNYLKVTPDGTIIFRNARFGQVIVLEPSVNAGMVTWRCIGSRPDRDIPSLCRQGASS